MNQADEYKEAIVEMTEMIEVAENALLAVEEGFEFSKKYDEIFRALHNLKGVAGILKLKALARHVHHLESDFMALKGQNSVENGKIAVFINGCDQAKVLLKEFEIDEEPAATPGFVSFDDDEAIAPPAVTSPSQPTSSPKVQGGTSGGGSASEERELIDRFTQSMLSDYHELHDFLEKNASEAVRQKIQDYMQHKVGKFLEEKQRIARSN